MKIVMHIDVNNAFLSWEAIYLLNNGYKYDIRNSYSAIGGSEKERRGVVLAKSSCAKKMGVTTGEPLFQARKKCKSLKVYPPHHHFYKEMSNKMMNLIKKYTPNVEIASIDECYLDYTELNEQYESPLIFAQMLQQEIYKTLCFTVNIGIANNKLCAKIASDLQKPFKINTIFNNEIELKMYPLSVDKLYGIGKKTAPKLNQLGINTIKDLANYDEFELSKYFKNQAVKMINAARGVDNSEIIYIPPEAKGISRSTTLSKDIKTKNEVFNIIRKLSASLIDELRNINKYTCVVTVFLKNSDFKVTSHQKKLLNPINNLKKVLEVSNELLDEMWKNENIRLVGLRFDKLIEKPNIQMSVFDEDKNIELYEIVGKLKKKFGEDIIKSLK